MLQINQIYLYKNICLHSYNLFKGGKKHEKIHNDIFYMYADDSIN